MVPDEKEDVEQVLLSVGKALRRDYNLLKSSGGLANGDMIPHLPSLRKEELPPPK